MHISLFSIEVQWLLPVYSFAVLDNMKTPQSASIVSTKGMGKLFSLKYKQTSNDKNQGYLQNLTNALGRNKESKPQGRGGMRLGKKVTNIMHI